MLIASCIGKRYSRAHGRIVFSSSRHIKCYIHVDLEVMLKPRDLKSTVDLGLMRSLHTYFDAYQLEDLDDIVIFCLRMVSSIVKKKTCADGA